jgi:hypothetical protein
MMKPLSAVCPECENRLVMQVPPRIGQLFTCTACGELLLVVSRNPVTLSLAHEEEAAPVRVAPPRRRAAARRPQRAASWYDYQEE